MSQQDYAELVVQMQAHLIMFALLAGLVFSAGWWVAREALDGAVAVISRLVARARDERAARDRTERRQLRQYLGNAPEARDVAL